MLSNMDNQNWLVIYSVSVSVLDDAKTKLETVGNTCTCNTCTCNETTHACIYIQDIAVEIIIHV